MIIFNKTSTLKLANTELYSWISSELLVDPKGFTELSLGTTGLGDL
jgi:hypothetical protein